jgi:hypothetical protein
VSKEQTLLDPTAESSTVQRPRIARPASLEDMTVGLLDISKPRGDEFLDRLEELLRGKCKGVKRYAKPRFSMIAPTELRQTIAAECAVVVEALAD